MNMKNRILVSILLLLCPFTLRAQTSYGRIQTDRISNKQIIIITGATPDVSNGNVFKTNNGAPRPSRTSSAAWTLRSSRSTAARQTRPFRMDRTLSLAPVRTSPVHSIRYTDSSTTLRRQNGFKNSTGGTGNPGGGVTDVQVNNAGRLQHSDSMTPDGVPQTLVSTPSGGPTQATFAMAGLKWRIISAASDSVVPADRSPKILQFTNMGGTTGPCPTLVLLASLEIPRSPPRL